MATLKRSAAQHPMWSGRHASSLVLLSLGLTVVAQKPAGIDLSIRMSAAFTESQTKFVREALLANDPECLVWPDIPTQRIVVRTVVPLDQAYLEQYIAPAGLHIQGVDLILPVDPQERMAMIMASFGFPVLADTGHPQEDQNSFAVAKAAWIAADPDRYDDLLRALAGSPQNPQER